MARMRTPRVATVAKAPGETPLYVREWRTHQAMSPLVGDAPCIMNGHYSWIPSPETGYPLQIDLFYPKIVVLGEQELPHPVALAVEIQSILHRGGWDRSKKAFFKTMESWAHYQRNQQAKHEALRLYRVPLLEIDPTTEDLSPEALLPRIAALLKVKLA